MSAATMEPEGFQRIFTTPLVRHTDMASDLQNETMQLCIRAYETYPNNNQSAAQFIKERMDKKFSGSWHAVIGWQGKPGHKSMDWEV